MFANLEKEYMENIIKDELQQKFGYSDFEGKTYRDLLNRLARFRATEVDVSADENKWF